MSVINKMLQDLEQRQTQPTPAAADYQPPSSNVIKYLGLAVILLLALLITLLLWQKTQKTVSDTITAEAATITKAKTVPDTITAEAATITEAQTVSDTITAEAATITEAKTVSDTITTEAATITEAKTVSDTITPITRFSVSQSDARTLPLARLKQQAREALQQGDQAQAVLALQQLLKRQPDNIKVRKQLAALLFSQQRQSQAQELLQQGIAKHPQTPELRLMLAKLQYQQGQSLSALTLLLEYSPAAASSPDYLGFRAALAQQVQRYAQAAQDYKQLLAAAPSNSKWWLGYAICQDRLGQVEEAADAYSNVLKEHDIDPNVKDFVHKRLIELMGGG